MAPKLVDIDKLQRQDHDTIIRIETKVDEVSSNVKTMGDGVMAKLSEHEVRIRKIEDTLIQSDPTGNINRLRLLEQQVHDFVTSANTVRFVIGITSGAISSVITVILAILSIYFKIVKL